MTNYEHLSLLRLSETMAAAVADAAPDEYTKIYKKVISNWIDLRKWEAVSDGLAFIYRKHGKASIHYYEASIFALKYTFEARTKRSNKLADAAPELLELAKDYLASLLSTAKYLEFNDDRANELPTIKKVRAIIDNADGYPITGQG